MQLDHGHVLRMILSAVLYHNYKLCSLICVQCHTLFVKVGGQVNDILFYILFYSILE
jgi:hypothetical protein